MSETATFRTANGFPRWSMTRYAAARPNTWPALHSAPRGIPETHRQRSIKAGQPNRRAQ
jgi:hypothetical protein